MDNNTERDDVQHGIDDNPHGDAGKGALMGGLGGAAVGALAGGPVGRCYWRHRRCVGQRRGRGRRRCYRQR